MNVLLIEDEQPAARRLKRLLTDHRPDWHVVDVIDSVEATVQWLRTFPLPDLLFMDIQLADGISLDVFRQIAVRPPVIFTTAYDQYTLQAFKVNSVDYLLKPIDDDELEAALQKFESLRPETPTGNAGSPVDSTLDKLLRYLTPPAYKERLLVKSGPQLLTVPVSSLAYLYSDEGLTFAVDTGGKRHLLDYTLDEAAAFLDPKPFFRISRKLIVHLPAIHRVHAYFNSRLKLDLLPTPPFEVLVSRERVGDFKAWLDT